MISNKVSKKLELFLANCNLAKKQKQELVNLVSESYEDGIEFSGGRKIQTGNNSVNIGIPVELGSTYLTEFVCGSKIPGIRI